MQGAWQASPGAGDLPCKTLTSRFRGVCWNKKNKRWQSAINVGGRYVYLGSYQQEEDAARAFDEAALRMRGKEARTNFCIENYVCAETGEVNVQCCARVEAALMAAQEAAALAEQAGCGRSRPRALSPQQHSPPGSACGSPTNPAPVIGDGVTPKQERGARRADSLSNNSTSSYGANDASDAFIGEVSQRLPAGSVLERVLPCGHGMLGFVYRVGTSQQACAALLHGTHWDEGGTYSSVPEASRACAFAAKVLATERTATKQQVLDSSPMLSNSPRSVPMPPAPHSLECALPMQQQKRQHEQAQLHKQLQGHHQQQQQPLTVLQHRLCPLGNDINDTCAGLTGPMKSVVPDHALGLGSAMPGSPRAVQLATLGYRQGPAAGQSAVGRSSVAEAMVAPGPLRVVTTTHRHPWGSHVAPETPPPAALDTWGRGSALLAPVASLQQTSSLPPSAAMPPSAPSVMMGSQLQLASYGSSGPCLPDEEGMARAMGLRTSACPMEHGSNQGGGHQCNAPALHSLSTHAAALCTSHNVAAGSPGGLKRTQACGSGDLAAYLPRKRLALA